MTVQKRQEIAMLGQFSGSNTRFRICLCVCVQKHQTTHQEELWCYLDSHLHAISPKSSFGASRASSDFWSHDGGENSRYFWARLLKLNWGSTSSRSHTGTWGRAASDFFVCVQVLSGLTHALKNAIVLCVSTWICYCTLSVPSFPGFCSEKIPKKWLKLKEKWRNPWARNISIPWKQLHLFLKECIFFLSMHYGPYHVSQTQFTPYIQ